MICYLIEVEAGSISVICVEHAIFLSTSHNSVGQKKRVWGWGGGAA